MTLADSTFAGSIPELYDRLMVPMIFEPYAADMAARVAALKPQRVLETAAGTGVVTRAMLAALPKGAGIVATDLNPAMLQQAQARITDVRVTWQQADALALPFAEAGFDAVVCQFGMMFFPDRVQGYSEARRVLKPGGAFLFNVWDGIAANAFVRVATEALVAIFPQDPPQFMARTPHGHHDLDLIRAELLRAGFGTVTVDTISAIAHAASAEAAAMAYCQGTPLRAEIEARGGALGEVTDRVAAALAAAFGTGPITGDIRASVVSAG